MPSYTTSQPATRQGSADDLLAADTAVKPATVEGLAVAPSPESTILPDVLDETSTVERQPVQVLLGDKISSHLSVGASYTVDTEQMTAPAPTRLSGFQLADYGWDSVSEYPMWFTKLLTESGVSILDNAVMLCSTYSTTTYVDPDQGGLHISADVPIYSHMSAKPMVDPQINEAGQKISTGESRYGSAVYLDPIFYHPGEELALYNKFGFDAVVYSPDPYEATYERMQDELADLLSMMSIDVEPRANIRKTTYSPNLFDNFEAITSQENVENSSLVQESETTLDNVNAAATNPANTSGPADGGTGGDTY